MFHDYISSTGFNTSKMNEYFYGKVQYGDTYGNYVDQSALSTLRALLYDKLDQDEMVEINCFDHNALDYNNPVNIIARDKNSISNNNTVRNIVIINIRRANPNNFNHDEAIGVLGNGYHQIKRITEFFKKDFAVYCYINEEQRSIFIVGFDLNVTTFHAIQCSFVGMMPWWIDASTMDEDRMALIYALREKNS